jgi:hypothetical protein
MKPGAAAKPAGRRRVRFVKLKTTQSERQSLYRGAIGARRERRKLTGRSRVRFAKPQKQASPTGGASIAPPSAPRKPKE